MTTPIKRAVGTFKTKQDAERALLQLRDTGFDMDRISAISKNSEPSSVLETESSDRAKEGAETGAVIGATTGGILGLIGSLSVLAIPGVGLATEVAVLLGNALLGSGVFAAGGSLVGALIGWGIPEEEALQYQDLLSQGYYVVLVEGTETEINSAKTVLSDHKMNNWQIYNPPHK